MHTEDLSPWHHDHSFGATDGHAARSTRLVTLITAAMMIIEIAGGLWFNSMALLADGWHMSSHALAIGLATLAYAASRRYAQDRRFAFGTWKIEILGGYTSAIMLLGVAVLMVFASAERLLAPQSIHYQQAIVIATVGLMVNVVCALILGRAHHHDQDHAHGHHHDHHHDLNLKSAYLHVVADAATSVLAIVALCGGWLYGLSWLDPVMGIVGAALVAHWARGLIIETGKVLLDREMDHPITQEIREAVETGSAAGDTRLADLHVWRVGKNAYACALSLITDDPTLTPEDIRRQLAVHHEIAHATIEVHLCPDHAPLAAGQCTA
jgi:cation diffusion facilitator family transporter